MWSPGSVAVRIDLPAWLVTDLLGCGVWLALAVALERVAAPAFGVAPGLMFAGAIAGGAVASLAAVDRRRRPMAVSLDERRIAAIAPAGGRRETVTAIKGSRVMGRTVLFCARTTSGGRVRLWIMPYDVPPGSVRRLALGLRGHAGSLEA